MEWHFHPLCRHLVPKCPLNWGDTLIRNLHVDWVSGSVRRASAQLAWSPGTDPWDRPQHCVSQAWRHVTLLPPLRKLRQEHQRDARSSSATQWVHSQLKLCEALQLTSGILLWPALEEVWISPGLCAGWVLMILTKVITEPRRRNVGCQCRIKKRQNCK